MRGFRNTVSQSNHEHALGLGRRRQRRRLAARPSSSLHQQRGASGYDWSDLNRVVLTTTDSNVWGGASSHTYTFTRQPNGTTDIDVVVIREGKNLKGRMLVLGTIGRRVLGRAFENSVRLSKRGTPRGKIRRARLS